MRAKRAFICVPKASSQSDPFGTSGRISERNFGIYGFKGNLKKLCHKDHEGMCKVRKVI
jgi:hypothetical protein